MNQAPLRIATRASRLALWQANHVADLLRQRDSSRQVEIVPVSTLGDRDKTEPLARLGGEGVFTREIQKAVLDGAADIAVHSLKDLPTQPSEGLVLAAVPERESPFDALVLPAPRVIRKDETAETLLSELPPGARVGTGSPRRRAQLLHYRSDLQMLEVRGNVETRLAKLDNGEYDALVLADAGLRRLDLEWRVCALLKPPLMFSAVGQGALGIECRADDQFTQAALAELIDLSADACVRAERRVLAALRAGCHAPLGVSTQLVAGQLRLEAVVLSADGKERLYFATEGSVDAPVALGDAVADELIEMGADRLVASTGIGSDTE